MESLVLWEVSRKQNYIFESNTLKENIGASIIVEKVVEELPSSIDSSYSENLVYNGGGSSLYRFDTEEDSKEFIKSISENILRKYPGIEIFMIKVNYDKKKDKIIEVMGEAYRRLAIKKNRRLHSGQQTSFGIEKRCTSTGLVAVESELNFNTNKSKDISEEIKLKLEHSRHRSEKFNKLIPQGKETTVFNDLVRGDKNYIAVVHIDGNKMGQKVDSLREIFKDKYQDGNYEMVNSQYISALKAFSKKIKELYEQSFIEMTKAIQANKDKLLEDTAIDEGKFPIIPIIVAGDDITYVTNGKIGIETARVFLEYLSKSKIEIYDGQMYDLNACAGIAIVRTSYPFVRAYELAEDLCGNAKTRLRDEYPDGDYSLLDWHVEQGDLIGNISEIRQEQYRTVIDNKNLSMRPLYLNNGNDGEWRTYDNFIQAYENINESMIARNKIKELREILRKGEKETELFLQSNNITGLLGSLKNTVGEYCFNGSTCIYYDAIEVLDMYIRFNAEGEENEKL